MTSTYLLFFFSSRRRHTRSLCDWSSDVCSSDLEDSSSRDSAAGRAEETCQTERQTCSLSESQRREGEEEIHGSRRCRAQKEGQLDSKIAGKTGSCEKSSCPEEGEEETQSIDKTS